MCLISSFVCHIFFYNFFMLCLSKTFIKNNFTLFFATFSPKGIVKGLFFNIFNRNIWSKWLLGELIISLYNFERKCFKLIFQFFGFLSHFSKIYRILAYFRQNLYLKIWHFSFWVSQFILL